MVTHFCFMCFSTCLHILVLIAFFPFKFPPLPSCFSPTLPWPHIGLNDYKHHLDTGKSLIVSFAFNYYSHCPGSPCTKLLSNLAHTRALAISAKSTKPLQAVAHSYATVKPAASKQAIAYCQMSLLHHPPGHEAYPDDVFY